ncbi:MAG: hotdog fold thioesterase [Byssovorax sp.]
MELDILHQVAEELIPFNKFLGIKVTVVEHGRVEMVLPFREELIGDPMKRALHGGVISTLVDTAGGMAIWGALVDPHQRVSTIDLRIDYLRPGKPEALVCEGVAVRVGRSVGVADMRAFHRSAPAETVATGKGVYAIKSPRPSKAVV